jgi:hypothetical protein
MCSIRRVAFVSLFALGLAAPAACSATSDDDQTGSVSSQIRNDGKQEGASNPDKLSCGPGEITSEVDLGGVNRNLDLGFGCQIEIDTAKQGPLKQFDWLERCNTGATPIPIDRVLARAGNNSGDATGATCIIPPAHTSGENCGTPEGSGNKGLNRIAFCFKPPPTPPKCGDNHKDPGEECDGADDRSCGEGKKCDDHCKCVPENNPKCGDNHKDPGEECDGRDDESCGMGKKCDDHCKCVPENNPKCGDNHKDPGEECDGRDDESCGMGKKCDDHCKCVPENNPKCGDGHKDPGEECDGADDKSCGMGKKCDDHCKCVAEGGKTW